MNITTYRGLLYALGAGFAIVFVVIVVPPLIDSRDIIAAFAAGFVNPYSTGYSLDVIFCWLVLAVWVLYEARTTSIRYGWIALVIGIVPGVATGFAVYLLMRLKQAEKASI